MRKRDLQRLERAANALIDFETVIKNCAPNLDLGLGQVIEAIGRLVRIARRSDVDEQLVWKALVEADRRRRERIQ